MHVSSPYSFNENRQVDILREKILRPAFKEWHIHRTVKVTLQPVSSKSPKIFKSLTHERYTDVQRFLTADSVFPWMKITVYDNCALRVTRGMPPLIIYAHCRDIIARETKY